MATEFLQSQGPGDLALRITPSDGGDLQVLLDGTKIYDRKEKGGEYPDRNRVVELSMVIAERVSELDGSPAG